jgi:hypothetical protein
LPCDLTGQARVKARSVTWRVGSRLTVRPTPRPVPLLRSSLGRDWLLSAFRRAIAIEAQSCPRQGSSSASVYKCSQAGKVLAARKTHKAARLRPQAAMNKRSASFCKCPLTTDKPASRACFFKDDPLNFFVRSAPHTMLSQNLLPTDFPWAKRNYSCMPAFL